MMGVRRMMENNILHHQHLLNITPFRDQHKVSHIANLTHKLNYKGTTYDTTMLRARSAQINSLNVSPIFNILPKDLCKIDSTNNLLVAQLQLVAEYDLTFPMQDPNVICEYTVSGNGIL